MQTILVTGAAGFIGFHVCRQLIAEGYRVAGFDNLNDYYDVRLKRARLAVLEKQAEFSFHLGDLTNQRELHDLFEIERPAAVVHLAAQSGVRHSLVDPHAYVASNLVGFVNLLEAARRQPPAHLVFASSSSVYGTNGSLPFSEQDNVDHPVSLYAATKKSNELIAHSYAHLFQLPCTGLRFFTVYGPWGRPDMAVFKFTQSILAGLPIDVYHGGNLLRDFTYVDDVVEAIARLLPRPPEPAMNVAHKSPNTSPSQTAYRIYNIGNQNPVTVNHLIETIEQAVGRKALRRMLPMQPGDVLATAANVSDLEAAVGFAPRTTLAEGIARFVQWYLEFYQPGLRTRAA